MANEEQCEYFKEREEISEDVLTINKSFKLCEDISTLYCKQKYSDVTFIIDGQKIHAHKVILAARSKYFDSLFNRDTKQSEITLRDVPTKAFRKVLKYIYTGSITIAPSDLQSTMDVLELAKKYFLKDLEPALEKEMSSVINLKTVCSLLNVASSYEMPELQDTCHSFMDENVAEILANDILNNLTQKSMIKLLQRDTFAGPEIDIFKSVEKWCKVNDDVDNLVVKCVRLSSLSEKEIILIVRPSRLIKDEILFNVLVEITAGKARTSQRQSLFRKDENIATPGHKARVISGTNTSFLLNDGISGSKDINKCASHSIGDKSGITVKLGFLSYINHIYLNLWDEDKRCYFYYIEISLDGIKWQKVIDYSPYPCHSYQNLYFHQKLIAQYIRVVGTHSTTSQDFVLVSFETYLKTNVPKVVNGIICPTENVATEAKGAYLTEGRYDYGSPIYDGIWHIIGNGSIIVQLVIDILLKHQ